jgi:hypothetical protein
VEVDAPRRPVSTAGLDGVAKLVSAPPFDLAARHQFDEVAAARVASRLAAAEPVEEVVVTDLEVLAADEPEPGFLDSLVTAVVGFLFG